MSAYRTLFYETKPAWLGDMKSISVVDLPFFSSVHLPTQHMGWWFHLEVKRSQGWNAAKDQWELGKIELILKELWICNLTTMGVQGPRTGINLQRMRSTAHAGVCVCDCVCVCGKIWCSTQTNRHTCESTWEPIGKNMWMSTACATYPTWAEAMLLGPLSAWPRVWNICRSPKRKHPRANYFIAGWWCQHIRATKYMAYDVSSCHRFW